MAFHSISGRGVSAVAALALLASSAPTSVSAQDGARVALPATAIVHNDSMSLADLLPASAAAGIRTHATDILIGAAPHTGSQRTISRSELVRALGVSPELLGDLEIPQTIAVRRWCRLLTHEEIAAAIEKSIAADDATQPVGLSAQDVTLQSPVAVTEEAPVLNVMRIEPQAGASVSHVALWIPSEPRTPPFWVTIDRGMGVSNCAARHSKSDSLKYSQTAQAAKSTAQSARSAGAASESLVRAGKPLQLIVQGGGMRIIAKATALETGRQGQQIRVQCEPAGKIVLAKVVSAGAAEIDF